MIRREQDGRGERLSWQATEGQEYALHFLYGHLSRAEVCWGGVRGPSIDDVTACFGEPALYDLMWHQSGEPAWRLSLWYPERGLVVDASAADGHGEAVPFALASAIECIHLLPASNLTGMAFALVPGAGGGAVYDLMQSRMLARLKPWSGALDQMEATDCAREPVAC